jgi:hypothetical protein
MQKYSNSREKRARISTAFARSIKKKEETNTAIKKLAISEDC